MIIVSGGHKGGSGKSTAAVLLAISRAKQGRDVLLVDTDHQHNAFDFTLLRNERIEGGAGYTCIKLDGKAVRTEVLRLAEKYDDIVIDSGARDTQGFRYALTVADVLLIPCVPSTFDVWTIQKDVALVGESRAVNPDLRALVYLNQAETKGSENEDAQDMVRDLDELELLEDVIIVSRKAFRHAISAGRSLAELEGQKHNPKAIAEFDALVAATFGAEEDPEWGHSGVNRIAAVGGN